MLLGILATFFTLGLFGSSKSTRKAVKRVGDKRSYCAHTMLEDGRNARGRAKLRCTKCGQRRTSKGDAHGAGSSRMPWNDER